MATVMAAASYSRGDFSLYLASSAKLLMFPGGISFHLEPGTIPFNSYLKLPWPPRIKPRLHPMLPLSLRRAALTKRSPPLDVRATISDPSGPDSMTTLSLTYDVLVNTPTPVDTNTQVDPTE